MAPPGFCNRGEVRYGSIGGLEYEVPQSRLYCLCINVALCSTALQCICRVIRRSSTTMKAHTYYIIFGRPPIGGEASPFPRLAAPLRQGEVTSQNLRPWCGQLSDRGRLKTVKNRWKLEKDDQRIRGKLEPTPSRLFLLLATVRSQQYCP